MSVNAQTATLEQFYEYGGRGEQSTDSILGAEDDLFLLIITLFYNLKEVKASSHPPSPLLHSANPADT